MQVLGNPGVAVCEEMEGVNGSEELASGNVSEMTAGTGEFTSGSGSEMVANDTTSGRNVTCVTCGELWPKYLYLLQ